MKHLKTILYAAVVVALLAGLSLYADPVKVATTLASANPLYILIGIGLGILALFVRVMKWAVLLEKPFRQVFVAQITGVMISNFTPGKIAEPVKAILLKRKANVDVSKALPSIIWERVIDLVVVMILSLFVFTTLHLGGNLIILSFLGVIVFSALAVVTIAVIYSQRFGRWVFGILKKFPILNKMSDSFIDNFYAVRVRKRNVAKCFFWTFVAWIIDATVFYVSFLALGIDPLPLTLLAGIMSLSIIIAIASTLPGGIGSFEIVASVLLGIAGIVSATSVSIVFLFRILTFWLSVFVGTVLLVKLRKKPEMAEAMKATNF